MRISRLALGQFRAFAQLRWTPSPALNWLYGDNGAGKTTLLEALSVLARGRSFRTAQLNELARDGDSGGWQVRIEVARDGLAADDWRARYQQRQLRLRCNESAVTQVEAARALPLLVLVPGLHRMIDEGPAVRRGLIDWGLFHVEQAFLPAWRQYQRALRQRNQLLRQQASVAALRPWTQLAADAGERLTALRQAYVQAVLPSFQSRLAQLLPEVPAHLRLYPGWAAQQTSLADALDLQLDSDRQGGHTRVGPHRAELRILVQEQYQARARLSRGQQKLLVLAFALAQAEQVAEHNGLWGPLLIDDWAAELSPTSAERLWNEILRYPGQRWLTDFTPPPAAWRASQVSVFHVEQGGVHEC